MISLEGVGKTFRGGRGKLVHALKDLNLEVPRGQVFGFLGPNGAGKSTTIKIMLNLLFPDEGRVIIGGVGVGDSRARKNIGYLPENAYFYDHLTAEELLTFGGKASGVPKAELPKIITELLARVDLSAARKRPLRSYSKGMVQRAGLALALVHNPEVIVLDEPMSGLDPIGRKMVGDLILEMKNEGKTVFFSSHILNDIERFCDRFGIIVNGSLGQVGTTEDLLAKGQSLEELLLAEVATVGHREVL